MAYRDTLASELVSGIATALAKVWLANTGLPLEIVLTGLTAIKGLAVDSFAQRKARRMIEDISEKIAERLVAVFETEGTKLDEGERAAVATALADVFSSDGLDATALVADNLDASQISKRLLAASQSAVSQMGEAETELFRRVLAETCSAVVGVASELPAFTEASITSLLKSQDRVEQSVIRVLDMLKEDRLSQEVSRRDDKSRFEIDYRRSLRSLDKIELFGIRAPRRGRRYRYDLSVAYITLTAEARRKQRPSDDLGMLANAYRGLSLDKVVSASGMGSLGPEDKRRLARRQSVHDLLAFNPRLFVRGIAGSGKTTLMQWIAVRAARGDFEGNLAKLNGRIPFFIRLRHRVQASHARAKLVLPSLHEFIDEVQSSIGVSMPLDWVREQLEAGNGIVLIDGVDEVDDRDQGELQDWIADLTKRYPRNSFVVTARTHLPASWLDRNGFRSAELQYMLRADIEAFIDHWHQAVVSEVDDPEERAEIPQLAENLKALLRRSSEIRRLATSPLLCSMLCALHRDGQQQLPTERTRLYRECIEVLIDKREATSNIKLTNWPVMMIEQKLVLLRDLAYHFLVEGVSEVSRALAEEWIGTKMKSVGNLSDYDAEIVLEYLIQRSGIIREPVPGAVDFIHKTFQEYLAAQAALDQPDNSILIRNALQDEWLEVTVLATAMASKPVRDSLLAEFVEKAERGQTHRHQRSSAILAAACMEAAPEVEEGLKRRVQDRLKMAMPPRDRADARMVARAGQSVMPYLKEYGGRDEGVVSMCIACLAYIGTDEALSILAQVYTSDARRRVVGELLRVWDFFDREAFARQVLSEMLRQHPSLPIPALPSFDGIGAVLGVDALTITSPDYVTAFDSDRRTVDFSGLSTLKNLKRLTIAHCRQSFDLDVVGPMLGLVDLRLTGFSKFANLHALSRLTNLQGLFLSNCDGFQMLEGFTSLKNLTHLSLDLSHECGDVSPLRGLEALKFLALDNFKSVIDIKPLCSLQHLESLSLRGCTRIDDVGCLSRLPQLRELDIRGCSRVRNTGTLRANDRITVHKD